MKKFKLVMDIPRSMTVEELREKLNECAKKLEKDGISYDFTNIEIERIDDKDKCGEEKN